jgi:peptidoglycan/LPS O-acetylase OafA/YrhL
VADRSIDQVFYVTPFFAPFDQRKYWTQSFEEFFYELWLVLDAAINAVSSQITLF